MKNLNVEVTELSDVEIENINGGILFLLIPLLVNTTCAVIVAGPLIAAGLKGWNDYK